MSGVANAGDFEVSAITILGAAALLLPTSVGGAISPLAAALYPLAFACIVFFFIARTRLVLNCISPMLALIAIAIFGTVTSPLREIAWGGASPYVLLCALFVSDVRFTRASAWSVGVFYGVSFVLLVLGFGTIAGNSVVLGTIENSYKAISEDLFENMILWNQKPVTVFASHSIAAFAYFALAAINYLLLKAATTWVEKTIAGLCALGFVILLPMLLSNSGLFLFVAAIALCVWDAMRHGRLAISVPLIALGGIVALMTPVGSALEYLVGDLWKLVVSIVNYDASGLMGRYLSGGRLQPTYEYLVRHPLMPVGLSYSTAIALGDNFIAEYVIKFGPAGYILILLLLARFLLRWTGSPATATAIFLFFLAADCGYPLLTYGRMAGALPWLLIILNRAMVAKERYRRRAGEPRQMNVRSEEPRVLGAV